jgi:hypothetical protein
MNSVAMRFSKWSGSGVASISSATLEDVGRCRSRIPASLGFTWGVRSRERHLGRYPERGRRRGAPKKSAACAGRRDRAGARGGPEFMPVQQSSCPLCNDGDLACRLICGHFECRLQPMHPLIDGLPETMRALAPALSCGAPERSALPLLIAE